MLIEGYLLIRSSMIKQALYTDKEDCIALVKFTNGSKYFYKIKRVLFQDVFKREEGKSFGSEFYKKIRTRDNSDFCKEAEVKEKFKEHIEIDNLLSASAKLDLLEQKLSSDETFGTDLEYIFYSNKEFADELV